MDVLNNVFIEKHSKNMGRLIIREVGYDVAKSVTLENHYSKTWNNAFGVYNFGIFRDNKLLGVCVYGNLMNPKSYKNWSDLLEENGIIELNRMWIDDVLGKNAETIFLSSTFKIFKEKYPHVKIIQTFADGRLGCGTIYKASNFDYYGYSKSLFFRHIDTGKVYHKILIENGKRPAALLKVNRFFVDGKLVPFYVKTYRYGKVLNKRIKKTIKLKKLPYPEYEKGEEPIEGYVHPIGLCVKCYLFFDVIGELETKEKFRNYIIEHYDEKEFIDEIENQRNGKGYKWFVDEYTNKSKLKKMDDSLYLEFF